jgi:chloride channel 7
VFLTLNNACLLTLKSCAGDIQLTVPLMISVLSARWSANLFNEGLYDIHVELNHLPYLPYQPPPQTSTLRVREIYLYCVSIVC